MLPPLARPFALMVFVADTEAHIVAGGVWGSDLHWSRVPAHANLQGGTKTSPLLRGARAAGGLNGRDGNGVTSRPSSGSQGPGYPGLRRRF